LIDQLSGSKPCNCPDLLRRLAELGFTKLFNEIDMKEAARQGLLGLGSKPLDTEHIQAFLEDFGLDAEFGVHSRIRGLSGALTICEHCQCALNIAR
jgi:hypothetical protein